LANITKHDIRREYAAWAATPKRLKATLGLPLSKTAFADMKGINPRTLTRWEAQDDFKEMVRQRRVELANSAPNSAVAAVGPARPVAHGTALKKFETPAPADLSDDPVYDPSMSQDEVRYHQVKDTLLSLAANGNQGAIDLYMKHYGKPFIEAEQKFGNMFPDMTDEQLEAEVVKLLGAEKISRALAMKAAFS
jgi:hypothetical protein